MLTLSFTSLKRVYVVYGETGTCTWTNVTHIHAIFQKDSIVAVTMATVRSYCFPLAILSNGLCLPFTGDPWSFATPMETRQTTQPSAEALILKYIVEARGNFVSEIQAKCQHPCREPL
jgi:hypothetical protein